MKMEDTVGADGATRRRSSASSKEAASEVDAGAARYLNRELSMLAYMERTAQIGDLPLYDRPTYERTLAVGRFSGGND